MENDAQENTGFAGLNLSAPLVQALEALGYEEPTPIQREAIPILLSGRDLLGQAATGTGKTAAFALPMLERISNADRPDEDGRTPRGLVLVPTRELAMQVSEAFHKYGHTAFGTCVVPVYGGQAIQQQLRALRRGVDVIVATPGRALDHIKRGSMDLSNVRVVVLDEADEMLDMGFADDLEAILGALPEKRQTALLSATMAPKVAAIAARHLSDPVKVTIRAQKPASGEAPRVRQTAYVVPRQHKLAALGRILDMEDPASAIVFCRTRGEVDQLTESLAAHGYRAAALHGGLSQEQRDRVMRRFREGTAELLVATDVAARGLDIESVSHVVNYDVPSSPDAYVHRIGRTGRAGRAGVAITLAEPREHRYLRNIEQLTKQKIEQASVPTIVDLRAKKLELTRDAVEQALAAGDLEEYRVVVETLGGQHNVMDIATAAIKLAHEARVGSVTVEDIPVVKAPARPERSARVDRSAGEERERRPRADAKRAPAQRASKASDRKPRHHKDAEFKRLFIGMGRSAGVRPADIVGAIANEAGVSPRGIGAINIADGYSVVEVPGDEAETIIEALRATKLRGKKFTVREERDERPARPTRKR